MLKNNTAGGVAKTTNTLTHRHFLPTTKLPPRKLKCVRVALTYQVCVTHHKKQPPHKRIFTFSGKPKLMPNFSPSTAGGQVTFKTNNRTTHVLQPDPPLPPYLL